MSATSARAPSWHQHPGAVPAQTDPEVGYVVLETDVVGGEGLLADLRAVEDTVRVRVLYDHAGSPPAEAPA